jgi:hypothetical protein
LLKHIGCFHHLLFVKVELSLYDAVYKHGLENISYEGRNHRIMTITMHDVDATRMANLQDADRTKLFEILSHLQDSFFVPLQTSAHSYFHYKDRVGQISGSVAQVQLRRNLLVRNAVGTIVSPDGLAIATEQNLQLLADLPKLLIGVPTNALAIMLGVRETLDWSWFVARSREWRDQVQDEERPHEQAEDTWVEFRNWARCAVKLAEHIGGDVAVRLRQWVNDQKLVPWECSDDTVELYRLDGQFVWTKEEAIDNLLSIQARAEKIGLTEFFERIGFLPAPIPDHPVARWRYRYDSSDGPQWEDLQALFDLYDQDRDDFLSAWNTNEDFLWCPPHGWIAATGARVGGPQMWREALMDQVPIVWMPCGFSADRLTGLYQTAGAESLHVEPIQLAARVDIQKLPQKITDTLDSLRREIPRLGWLLPNGLTSFAIGSDDGIAAVWQKENVSINLPYPQSTTVVERTLCAVGEGTAEEQIVAFLREQGLKTAAAAFVEEMTGTEDRRTERPAPTPEQEEQAAREAVQSFQAALAARRGAGGGQRPTPINLPDPTLLPTSPEEAEQRLIEFVRRSVDPGNGLQNRVMQVFLTTANKNAEERTQGIRQDLAGWYHGSCQHCGEVITKRNGEPFFNDTRMHKVAAAKILDQVFNHLLLCPNCAARMNNNNWGFAPDAFRLPENDVKTWDPAWPNATAPSASGGYCMVQFTVAGEVWEVRFHPDHYEVIRVAFNIHGI